jgi:hypothetical protein
MGPLAQRCIDTFWASISRELAKKFLRCILDMYIKADTETKANYPPFEAHYMRGPQRRADIEVGLRGVAELDHEASGVPRWNKPHNQTHTLVTRGHIKLTCSRANNRYDVIRSSEFRKEYAEESQVLLFPDTHPLDCTPSEYLFAMIIHGPDQEDQSRPAFVDVVFPDRECQMYIARINLLKEFPEIFGDITPPPVEPTAPTDPNDPSDPDPTVTLRKDRKTRRARREKEA